MPFPCCRGARQHTHKHKHTPISGVDILKPHATTKHTTQSAAGVLLHSYTVPFVLGSMWTGLLCNLLKQTPTSHRRRPCQAKGRLGMRHQPEPTAGATPPLQPQNILGTRSGTSPGTTKKPLLIALEAMHSLSPILPSPDHTSRGDAEDPRCPAGAGWTPAEALRSIGDCQSQQPHTHCAGRPTCSACQHSQTRRDTTTPQQPQSRRGGCSWRRAGCWLPSKCTPAHMQGCM